MEMKLKDGTFFATSSFISSIDSSWNISVKYIKTCPTVARLLFSCGKWWYHCLKARPKLHKLWPHQFLGRNWILIGFFSLCYWSSARKKCIIFFTCFIYKEFNRGWFMLKEELKNSLWSQSGFYVLKNILYIEKKNNIILFSWCYWDIESQNV